MPHPSKYERQLRDLGFKEYNGPSPTELADFELALVDEAGEEVPGDIASFSEEVQGTLPCFWIIEFGSVAEGVPALGITMAFDENGNSWVHEEHAIEVCSFIPEFTRAGEHPIH